MGGGTGTARRRKHDSSLRGAPSPPAPPWLDCTNSGRALARLDVIALTTEQPQGRTVGWLPHVARSASERAPRRDLSLAVQRGDVADQAADLTTLMSDPAWGRLIPGATLGAPGS